MWTKKVREKKEKKRTRKEKKKKKKNKKILSGDGRVCSLTGASSRSDRGVSTFWLVGKCGFLARGGCEDEGRIAGRVS